MTEAERIYEVLRICLPVFALIGLGKLLSCVGFMRASHRAFLNKLVYNICLPALIFAGVVQQTVDKFQDHKLIIASLGAIVVAALVFFGLSRLLGYTGRFAAAFIFGSFWGNVTYMGFPLSENAYGPEGLGVAAIYNAFCMPFFVVLGFLIIGLHGAGEPGETLGKKIRAAFINPVVGSAILGGLVAVILSFFREGDGTGALTLHPHLIRAGEMCLSILALAGKPGLPLALLSIGGALQLNAAREKMLPIALVITGKLILIPAVSLLIFRCFAQTDSTVVGVVVLLGAMPNAVASYVIACKIGVEETFVSSMLVFSTLLSMITIPLWLYILL